MPIVSPHTGIISFQNGVTKDDMLRPIFGEQALLGGVAYVGTAIGRPGVIAQTGPLQRLVFGEYRWPSSPRVEVFYEACKRGGINAEISDDIRRSLWEKFVVLVGDVRRHHRHAVDHRADPHEPADARNSCSTWRARSSPSGAPTASTCPPTYAEQRVPFFDGWPPEMTTSMHHDLQRGKPLEVRWLSGGVVDLGAQVGVPTPINRAVRDILILHAAGGAHSSTRRNRADGGRHAPSSLNSSIALVRPILRRSASPISALVEPVGGVAEILERIIDREHDPVGADLRDRVEQRGRAEVAGGGDVEIGAEIVRHALASPHICAGLHPVVAVVDAPEVIRQPLAEMSENDLQPRALVEQTAADQPQGMHGGLGSEAPVRPEQPGVSFVERDGARQGVRGCR